MKQPRPAVGSAGQHVHARSAAAVVATVCGGDDEEVVLSLTLAGVLALGIVLQQLLHKKEVKWVTTAA